MNQQFTEVRCIRSTHRYKVRGCSCALPIIDPYLGLAERDHLGLSSLVWGMPSLPLHISYPYPCLLIPWLQMGTVHINVLAYRPLILLLWPDSRAGKSVCGTEYFHILYLLHSDKYSVLPEALGGSANSFDFAIRLLSLPTSHAYISSRVPAWSWLRRSWHGPWRAVSYLVLCSLPFDRKTRKSVFLQTNRGPSY